MIQPLQPGDPRRLGSWRLVGRLGSGGMGVVYLGEGRRKQRVAVKVLHPQYASDPTFRARFEREAQAAARVTTRATARVLEVGDGKSPYLVTEYVEGPTLRAAVDANGPLPSTALRDFASGLAEALVAMHAAGVIHRDLTPGNVILSREGPKIIDFGIARAHGALTLTSTGAPIGTPAWMAPEQAQGLLAGPPADTFGWGTLVAYAGTGRHPFGEGTADAVLYRVVHEAPALVGLDPGLVPLVRQALAKEPSARPLPADLTRASSPLGSTGPGSAATGGGAPATEARTTPGAPPRRRGRRVGAVVGLLLAGVAAAGIAVALFVLLDDDDGSSAAAPSPTRRDEPTSTTSPPTTSPGDLAVYCGLVEEYYERYDEFRAGIDILATEEEYDEAFSEFARDNSDLWPELREAAPPEIATGVDLVSGAFEQAAEGDLSAFDTEEVEEAEDTTSEFEERECGIEQPRF